MGKIQLESVTKSYGEVKAMDSLDLTLEKDKIYGLLGRNGAGKTTLLNTITGRIFADAGSILMGGEPIVENDRALGRIYMASEQELFPENMKLRDAVRWTSEFYPDFNKERAGRLAETFSLSEKKKFSGLSTGYKTIYKLVLALSSNAPYLFLDEPVLGLDANHRDLFYKALLDQYAHNPFCVVLSTHLVEEVSGLIEDVLIMREGKLICSQPRETLLSEYYAVSGTTAGVDAFVQGKTVLGHDAIGNLKSAYVQGPRPQDAPEGLEVSGVDLQKLFIQLTNEREGLLCG